MKFTRRGLVLIVTLLVLGAGVFAIRESYFRGWSHGYNRAKCDYSGAPCPGIDEMGAPTK